MSLFSKMGERNVYCFVGTLACAALCLIFLMVTVVAWDTDPENVRNCAWMITTEYGDDGKTTYYGLRNSYVVDIQNGVETPNNPSAIWLKPGSGAVDQEKNWWTADHLGFAMALLTFFMASSLLVLSVVRFAVSNSKAAKMASIIISCLGFVFSLVGWSYYVANPYQEAKDEIKLGAAGAVSIGPGLALFIVTWILFIPLIVLHFWWGTGEVKQDPAGAANASKTIINWDPANGSTNKTITNWDQQNNPPQKLSLSRSAPSPEASASSAPASPCAGSSRPKKPLSRGQTGQKHLQFQTSRSPSSRDLYWQEKEQENQEKEQENQEKEQENTRSMADVV